ncbi:hypothetical protein L0F63_004242 [Massospora cicadina]|nr:hypothetical protein L0F63_004242 [Massospora cicadina]
MPLAAQLGSSEQRFRRRSLSLLLHEPTARAVLIRAKVLQRVFGSRNADIGHSGGWRCSAALYSSLSSTRPPVAPENFSRALSKVGGFDRVYEIGRVFRNEGVDATHNPEFTTCEFYVAYANLETLFSLTEELLSEVAQDAIGSLDLSGPIHRRIHVVEELTRLLGPLPPLDGPVEPYLELCNGHSIEVTPPLTMTRVLEALIGGLIEPQCTQPTFLYGHPLIMSPLAKAVDGTSALAARFELFIAQHEFINAYEELNSPGEQLSRFNAQLKDRQELGDFEIPELNEEFCEALSYGLPPTAGWGLGVDRLVALLSQSPNIRSTLTFPLLRSSKEVE